MGMSVCGKRHTILEINRIKREAALQTNKEKREREREKNNKVKFDHKQVEDAVVIIKFLPNLGLNIQKLFYRYGVRGDDQKEFIRRIGWNVKIKIVRISDNAEVDIEKINYEKPEEFLIKPI